ncbi:Uncharacterised protein (plasmid) [Tsukamurella tyrosinosolvens]|uniref:Uncharacterized protein n=1 Tax=Tsukamurella tyrosinosolvens TaxID=57704 RepID=A0A1H4V8A2_TSUTY|nr:hypothetical protein [Tsukamurella tyrosinosolvens]KXO91034.1 hypothetical protein AXK58_21630 [Tsukamurella tyrosinosolvens]SEC76751.1 hypothetical protein SAMN04489793_3161 [Tsukamurella tyrosinosolvens]VEH90650.1 Uncharacterised protein [Tsukamurella tyrosinosolvens]
MPEELIFHLAGDDHEERVYYAETEAAARLACADGFNEQYDASYCGDEFDLLGVYRVVDADASEVDEWDSIREARDAGEIARVTEWPRGS